MKDRRWMLLTALVLVPLSAALYFLHYSLFHDAHHIFIYLVGDVAFLPLEVFLVVIVLERVLTRHEKGLMLEKMNMLIGMFFEELGMQLLGELTECVTNKEELRPYLSIGSDWDARQYRTALRSVRRLECDLDMAQLDLTSLRDLLTEHRPMLMVLLANPNLLEHEEFTDLLWAVDHLTSELVARPQLGRLPDTDASHLAGDVRRVYGHLTTQWLHYCRHLQGRYPYIFSIVVRTHPLQENPDPTVH